MYTIDYPINCFLFRFSDSLDIVPQLLFIYTRNMANRFPR